MKEDFNYSDERFADIQMLRYRLNGFEQLSLRKKLYIYYLSQATLCGRDITFDQFGRYNIRIRKMLEQIRQMGWTWCKPRHAISIRMLPNLRQNNTMQP